MGKEKKEVSEENTDDAEKRKSTAAVTEGPTYEEQVELMSVIAKPLASKKLTKKLYKVVKKAQKVKRLRRGVKEVVKGLRKNEKGIVVLAGDVSPIDVVSHIPVFCEDKEIPYCFVPSRRDLGTAGGTKRPTSVVLIQTHDEYKDVYQEAHTAIAALPLPIS